jgi:ATP/maltotriose-dependent transcriptional regulator MalT
LTVLKRQVHPPAFEQSIQREFPSDDLTMVHDVLAELSLLKTNPLLLTELTSQQAVSTANDALLDPLTDRELEVLALMTQGLTNRQIAEELVVVLGTVKAHSHSIYSKLGVNNRVQAIKRAEELDLL